MSTIQLKAKKEHVQFLWHMEKRTIQEIAELTKLSSEDITNYLKKKQ